MLSADFTEKEFENFVENTKPIVLSVIGKYLNRNFYYTIDDIVQETYLRVYKSIKNNKFKGNSKIETWLYTIARNETFRMNNKYLKDKKLNDKIIKYYSENKKEITESKIKKENNIFLFLKEKIKLLPDKYRKVINFYLDGYKQKEIADLLNISKGTVKSRMHRGKKILYNYFNREKNNGK